MSNLYWVEPQYQDEVKSKINDTTGTVIAKYPYGTIWLVDIRDTEGKIHYASPVDHWDVVHTREELEGHSDV